MKKIYNLLLIFALVLIGGLIGVNNVNAENYGLFVNGEEFTSEKRIINCGSGTATYDNDTNTLTLNNATITKTKYVRNTESVVGHSHVDASIHTNTGDFKINLIGKNKITIPNTVDLKHNMTAGIVAPEVEFNGTGSLDIRFAMSFAELMKQDDGGHWITGVFVADGRKITINSGNIDVAGEFSIAFDGIVDTNNYDNVNIMGTSIYNYEEDEYVNYKKYTSNNLNSKYKNDEAISNVKIGNYKVYKINISKEYNNPVLGFYDDVGYAFEGATIIPYPNITDDLEYNIYYRKNIEIRDSNTDADITKECIKDYYNYAFTMPAKEIDVYESYIGSYDRNVASLKANLYGYNDVSLTINREDHAVGYYIYYKNNKEKNYSKIRVNNCSSKLLKCTYNIKNLKDGYNYTFRIVPYTTVKKEILESTNGKNTSIYTLKKLNKPKIKKKGKSKVKIYLTKINGVSGYEIAVSKKKNKKYKLVKTISAKTNSIKLKVKKNTKLYYKVRAYKKVNGKKIYAPWSNATKYKLK